MEVKEIPIDHIRMTGLNTRKDLAAGIEDSSIDDLAKSIEEKGLLSPIVVRSGQDGAYDLIAS